MSSWHRRFAFDMVMMLGDNLYSRQGAADFVQKFERPYNPLLGLGVKFYASLGNHDKVDLSVGFDQGVIHREGTP